MTSVSPTIVHDINGRLIDFDAATNLMDDDIREAIHDQRLDGDIDPDPQSFLEAYAAAHEQIHGSPFAPWAGGAW